MGKNTVEIKNPDAPMTDKQTYKLYMITGVTLYYMDKYPYTIQEASDLIDAALNGKAYHTRVELAQHEGAKVSWTDVGKDYREDTKPRGYAHAMELLAGEEDEEEDEDLQTPAPQKQGKTKDQKIAALKKDYEKKLKDLEKPTSTTQTRKKKSSEPAPDKTQAEILGETFGINPEKLERMLKAFAM